MRGEILEIYIDCQQCQVHIATDKREYSWKYFPCSPEGLAEELEKITEMVKYGESLDQEESDSIE